MIPHDRNELYGVSVSVCASICIQTSFDFFGGRVGGLTCDCEGNRLNSNDGHTKFLHMDYLVIDYLGLTVTD